MKLSAHQIEDFFQTGYLVLRGLFSASEIKEISDAFDRLQKLAATVTSTSDIQGSRFVVHGPRIDRVVWCGAAEPVLLKHSEKPELLVPVSQLLGSDRMEQLICQAHFKLPGDQVKFRWHQDSENRRYGTSEWRDINGRGSFVQTVTAVDEMAPDNGPLLLAPGSSQLGHLGLDKVPVQDSFVDESQMVPMLMQPGDVLLMHPFAIHGSHSNNSPRSRRVFINGYAYPGANSRVYPGEGAGRELAVPA